MKKGTKDLVKYCTLAAILLSLLTNLSIPTLAQEADLTQCAAYGGANEACLAISIVDKRTYSEISSNAVIVLGQGESTLPVRAEFEAYIPRYSTSSGTDTFINGNQYGDKIACQTSCSWRGWGQSFTFNLGPGNYVFRAEHFGWHDLQGFQLSDIDELSFRIIREPSAPTGLVVSNAGTSGANPRLEWDYQSQVDSYEVFRCIDHPNIYPDCNSLDDYSYIGSTSSTYFYDNDVQLGSSCYGGPGMYYKAAKYYIIAVTENLESDPSSIAGACTNDPANKMSTEPMALELQAVPDELQIEENYPNPFNPSTQIRFGLPERMHVSLVVFDAVGREVARLADKTFEAGYHTVTWNAAGLPSGLYLSRLQTPQGSHVRRMMLLK